MSAAKLVFEIPEPASIISNTTVGFAKRLMEPPAGTILLMTGRVKSVGVGVGVGVFVAEPTGVEVGSAEGVGIGVLVGSTIPAAVATGVGRTGKDVAVEVRAGVGIGIGTIVGRLIGITSGVSVEVGVGAPVNELLAVGSSTAPIANTENPGVSARYRSYS